MAVIYVGSSREITHMTALWGLFVVALAVLSEYIGITVSPLRFGNGRSNVISREQDPASFRKAVGVHIVIGLIFIIAWFINHYWPSV